jgi:hypothetical protein
MEEPKEHLIETINALEDDMRGLLILIYVHRGIFDQNTPDLSAIESVSSITGVEKARMIPCLNLADGTFVRRKSGTNEWQFAHPTVFDALTEIVSSESNMQEALVRGVRIDFILTQFTDSGHKDQNRTILHSSLEDLLLARLEEVLGSDEFDVQYLRFMQTHVSDKVFIQQYKKDQKILLRKRGYLRQLHSDPMIGVVARAHKLGLLSEDIRREFSESIKNKILNDYDFTIFEYPELLDVVEPTTLVEIGCDLFHIITDDLLVHIRSIGEDKYIDLDFEPDHYFDEIDESLKSLEHSTLNANVQSSLNLAYEEIEIAKAKIRSRKDEYDNDSDEEEEETDHYWSAIQIEANETIKQSGAVDDSSKKRSIFSDVAE